MVDIDLCPTGKDHGKGVVVDFGPFPLDRVNEGVKNKLITDCIQMQTVVHELVQLALIATCGLVQQRPHVEDGHAFLRTDPLDRLRVLPRDVKFPIQLLRRIPGGQVCPTLVGVDGRRGEQEDAGTGHIILGIGRLESLDKVGEVGGKSGKGDMLL